MESLGFAPEDYEGDEVEVWPENEPAYRLFCVMNRQWRVGMNGATGLVYEALYPLLDRRTSTTEEWDALFEDIRVMEAAVLSMPRKP